MIYAAVSLLFLVLIIMVRTLKSGSSSEIPLPTVSEIPPLDLVSRHLGEAVRIPTVMFPIYEETDWTPFREFAAWLEDTYPLLHRNTDCTILEGYTRVYHWEGEDPSLKPVLFTAHQDVVPPGDDKAWSRGPFSGIIEDGYLWGRGAIDMKVQLTVLLETVEFLLGRGYRPKRTLYIVLGHDEEVGGSGARAAASYFLEKGIEFYLLIDEGGCVSEGVMPGLAQPAAIIGIAEKGYADIELEAVMEGGHSSMPPRRTSMGMISQVLSTCEQRRFPLQMTEVSRQFFSALRPHMPFFQRMVISNLWLFKPLFLGLISRSAAGNAMVRTTAAATMASGSDAPNVLPARSRGTVNIRLLPGYSLQDISRFAEGCIGSLPVSFELKRAEPPSGVTSIHSEAYTLVGKTVRQVFPDAVVAPYLMTGGTDARKYESVCRNICRFTPCRLTQEEIDRMHSADERISLENIEAGLRFFMQLLENLDEQATGSPRLPS